MALPSTIRRFTIEVSDIDRGCYETHDLRVAQHPSETITAMLVRVFAYCLLYEEGMAFCKGVSTASEPALWVKDATGQATLWIEVGAPKPERLHKASKGCDRVVVWTHKDPHHLLVNLRSARIHRKEELLIVAIPGDFLRAVETVLARNNRWALVRSGGVVYLTAAEQNFEMSVVEHRV